MSQFVIEIDDGRNSAVVFAPINKSLRGRFSKFGFVPLAFTSDNDLAKMPDLPGQRIVLDAEAKVGRIVDPLNDKSSAQLRKEVAGIYATFPAAPLKPTIHGMPDETYPLRQTIDWNTWVWHCRRLVAQGLAKPVDGTVLPHVKGKIKCNLADWTKNAVKQRSVDTETEEMEAEINAEEREMIESAAAEA